MEQEEKKKNWLFRLKDGLKKSSHKLTEGISSVLASKKLDAEALAALEDILVLADLGVKTAQMLTEKLRKTRFNQTIAEQEVRVFLAQEIAAILEPMTIPLTIELSSPKPYLIMAVGVNGSGKTTTIGKLANLYKSQGLQVRLAAGDTFRAAAVEQLAIWGVRVGVPVEIGPQGTDPASLAYEAYMKARQAKDDILIIDTAGRLHNKEDLMAELAKMRRVVQKIDPAAPHETLLVLDATIGQNTHAQVEAFQKTAHITGLIVTKLDGTAKGGALVPLAEKFRLPVRAIGIGEGIDDLKEFNAQDFANGLMGI